jgi:hypothetical protein
MPLVAMADAVAGQVALSAEYNKLIDNIQYLDTQSTIVAFGRRVTSSSTSNSTTAVGVIRVNGTIISGNKYRIRTGVIHPTSTVTTDVARVEVRFSVSGNADSTSPVLPGALAYEAFGNTTSLDTVYTATANGTLSVALCVARETGSGNVSLFADGTRVTDLYIDNLGLSVASSGVNL